MSILATVTRPTSGTFLWKGADGFAAPLAVRREFGFLPQDFGVYERLTALEFLTYLGRLKGLSEKDLSRCLSSMLELVNLHHAADRPLGGFSGGIQLPHPRAWDACLSRGERGGATLTRRFAPASPIEGEAHAQEREARGPGDCFAALAMTGTRAPQ